MQKAGAGVNERVYFTYGVGGARYLKQVGAKRTYYLGKAYEEEIEDNHVKQTVYLFMGGKSIGIHTEVLDTTYVSTNSYYQDAISD